MTPLAGWAGWAVVPDLAMSGIVIPATAKTIAAITRKRAGPGAEPAGPRTFELHVYLPFMRSFGQAALVC